MIKKVLPLIFIITLNIFAELSVHDTTFSNGLRLLVVPDSSSPVVSCRLYYFMGSFYETAGTTGLSHLYEHMMFKGTKRLGTNDYSAELPIMAKIDSIDAEIIELKELGELEKDSLISAKRDSIFALLDSQREFIVKDEIWALYQKNGGTGLNAWTSTDMTAYIVTLPSNKVELFANIEADRMENSVLREFYSERDVVTEEWRMRYESKPENLYYQRLMAQFYTASPYRNPTIGWFSDIRNYSRKKLTDHIHKYYRPDNALIVLAGNVTAEYADSIVSFYFSEIVNSDFKNDPIVTREPDPIGVSRLNVESAGTPRVDILFHTPAYPSKELFALDVVESMLNGRSGILQKRLVDDLKMCNSAGAGSSWKLADGSFHIWASLKEGSDPVKVEQIIIEELKKLATKEPTEDELSRVKNGINYYFTKQLTDGEKLSDQLAFFEKLGSWRDMLEYEKNIGAVTKTSDVVKKYLNPKFRTVGVLTNPKEEKK
jgi:predicted Zn-dependent peptidase